MEDNRLQTGQHHGRRRSASSQKREVPRIRVNGTIQHAQNRAGREISNVTTIYPGKLPKGDDGAHYSSGGYIMLGKITATAVKEYYKAKE